MMFILRVVSVERGIKHVSNESVRLKAHILFFERGQSFLMPFLYNIILFCKAKWHHMLNCTLNRYCLLALYGSICVSITVVLWFTSYSIIVKVKVEVYSLISSLKTYHPTLHLTPWSLNLSIREPFQLHGEHKVLQPFRRNELIVHIAISVLPGTHFPLSQVKHLRVKCLAQGHNILTMSQDWEGRNMIFLWKKLHQAGFKTARQAATSAERYALTTFSDCENVRVKFTRDRMCYKYSVYNMWTMSPRTRRRIEEHRKYVQIHLNKCFSVRISTWGSHGPNSIVTISDR